MGNFTLDNNAVIPSHSVLDRSRTQNNGIFSPHKSYFVLTGSVSVPGDQLGIVEESIDTYGFELKRVEVFHSGAASSFDFSISNVSGSSGSLALIADYKDIPGSDDYSCGIDQIEQLIGLSSPSASIFLNFAPNLVGANDFQYLIFLEPAMIFINRDRTL